jgi:hypothetical protein
MPAILTKVLQPFKARLSRRTVLWVFISVIVIETIILIPSYILSDSADNPRKCN